VDGDAVVRPFTMLFAQPDLIGTPPMDAEAYDAARQAGVWPLSMSNSWCSGSSTGAEMFGGGDTDTYQDD
jgi:hypothetical protein